MKKQLKITCRRKESRNSSFFYVPSKETTLYLNGLQWSEKKKELAFSSSEVLITQKILSSVPKGTYYVRVTGGGVHSQVQVLQKVLLTVLKPQALKNIRELEPEVFYYVGRRVLPKQYGGRGARSRFQKSYR